MHLRPDAPMVNEHFAHTICLVNAWKRFTLTTVTNNRRAESLVPDSVVSSPQIFDAVTRGVQAARNCGFALGNGSSRSRSCIINSEKNFPSSAAFIAKIWGFKKSVWTKRKRDSSHIYHFKSPTLQFNEYASNTCEISADSS